MPSRSYISREMYRDSMKWSNLYGYCHFVYTIFTCKEIADFQVCTIVVQETNYKNGKQSSVDVICCFILYLVALNEAQSFNLIYMGELSKFIENYLYEFAQFFQDCFACGSYELSKFIHTRSS